jgi:hypothetical protein
MIQSALKQEGWLQEPPTIETEHYLMRGLSTEDATDLYVFMSDKKTMNLLHLFPFNPLMRLLLVLY